jgi:hypothetical protein
MVMTKIVVTKYENYTNKSGGRIYIDKERILEVHEADDKSYCTLIMKSSSKDPSYYHVCESFDDIKAMMEFDPAVADIVIKGNEL